ncbi:MAG: hypothetical protein PSV24_11165 [Rhodoferax sp.]|nr:hypothetical protein [Rhodoferax sp.]
MAWLIRQRAIIKGRLDRYQSQQEKLPDLIASVKAELSALDAVIPLHEIKLDPTIIKGQKRYSAPIAGYGELTAFILENLRNSGAEPVCSNTLTTNFMRKHGMPLIKTEVSRVGAAMRYRLKNLAKTGVVIPHHDRTPSGGLGLWTLAPHYFED